MNFKKFFSAAIVAVMAFAGTTAQAQSLSPSTKCHQPCVHLVVDKIVNLQDSSFKAFAVLENAFFEQFHDMPVTIALTSLMSVSLRANSSLPGFPIETPLWRNCMPLPTLLRADA